MVTSYVAARDYARGRSFSRGSALVHSALQGDPGPTGFEPGSVTPAAALVKGLHAYLAHASQERGRALAESQLQVAQDDRDAKASRDDRRLQIEEERLTLSKQKATAGQTKRTTHVFAPQATEMGLPGEGDYDPGTVTNAATLHGQKLNEKARAEREAHRQGSVTRYMKAHAALVQLDNERKQAADAAEASVRGQVDEYVSMAGRSPKSAPAYARVLGLSSDWSPKKGVPKDAGSRLITSARLKAEQLHNRSNAARRAALNKVISDEAGVVSSPGEQGSPGSEWARKMLEGLGVTGGGEGGDGTDRTGDDDEDQP